MNFVDLHPSDAAWGHHSLVDRDGIRLHFVRRGAGPSVLLLHGWPGFWYDWRRVIPALEAKGFDTVAPDFRGFGDSEKPDLPPGEAYSAEAQSASIQSCVEALDLQRMIVVGYDVGSRVAQTLARWIPKRIHGLVLCNPSYPGIGARRLEYAAQSEFWYQHFHRTSMADAVIGHSRETVRAYLGHFYDHWVGRKAALRKAEFDAIVDSYAREGAVRGSLNWVRSGAGTGLAAKPHEPAAAGDRPESIRITHPTRILWGELDPIFPPAWADGLSEYFPNMTLKMLQDVGHFAPFEAPEEIVAAVESLEKSEALMKPSTGNPAPGYKSHPEHRIETKPAGMRVRVTFQGELIADSRDAILLEEGKYSPVYYLPRSDVKMDYLVRSSHRTYCPFKGDASYFSLKNGPDNAVWSYEQPYDEMAMIKDRLAFYPDKVDSISAERL